MTSTKESTNKDEQKPNPFVIASTGILLGAGAVAGVLAFRDSRVRHKARQAMTQLKKQGKGLIHQIKTQGKEKQDELEMDYAAGKRKVIDKASEVSDGLHADAKKAIDSAKSQ